MRRAMGRGLHLGPLVGGALLMAAVACGDRTEDEPAAQTSSTSAAVETSETTSSTTDGSTTERPTTSESSTTILSSTTSQTSTTSRRSTTSAPAVKPVADGSGCTPGTGSLPDGTWYGYVVAADDAAVSFDLACFFTGDQAVAAADEDGAESPPPNDYYIRNVNRQARDVPISEVSRVTWYPDFGDPTSKATATYPDWVTAIGGREFDVGIWIDVRGGRIATITEQWVP